MTTLEPPPADGADPGRPTRPARHVLVVDDDELLREVAKAALELVGGWRVTTVLSGAEAQAQAQALQPDAILLDVMMPGLDGPGTLRGLREDARTRDIPVIFLTAKLPAGNHTAWEHLDLAGVIAKPFDPMTLATDMAHLLGWGEWDQPDADRR